MTGLSAEALQAESDALMASAADHQARSLAARAEAEMKARWAAAVRARDAAQAAADRAELAAGAVLAEAESAAEAVAEATVTAAASAVQLERDRDAEIALRGGDPVAAKAAALAALASFEVHRWNTGALADRQDGHEAVRRRLDECRAILRAAKDELAAAEAAVACPPPVPVAGDQRMHDLLRRSHLTRRPQLPGLSSVGIVRDGLPLPGGGAGG